MRVISGHYVFTGKEFIKNGTVEIDSSGKIVSVGSLGDSIVEKEGTEFFNGIIIPGFVNAHCHIELSHMKGQIPQHSGMTAFCNSVISYRNSDVNEQISAMYEADKLMENEGIVAVGDISNNDLSALMKKDSRLIYHTFVETLNLNPCRAEENIVNARIVKQTFENEGLRVSITPHAPYSLSEKLFAKSVTEGNNSGIISIHNEESCDEMELFAKKQGKMRDFFGKDMDDFLPKYDNPLHRILKYIAPETSLLLIHNTHTNEQDYRQTLKQNRKTTWVLCPASNLYIENNLPDVNMFAKLNAHVAIGTDSLSSNTNLSILQELKILDSKFPETGLQNLLRWATLNGAEALNLDSELGSFDLGKRPGVFVLSNIDFRNMRLTENSQIKRVKS
ncbi:MAG: amidohydrolase family protein [Prevotellaceae bacterium]|jgi:cytosine/adenosine deaminase-related metal-dependent hydrolase|nr:amidohydrolase family protein [Prevotellaceae bacterium]